MFSIVIETAGSIRILRYRHMTLYACSLGRVEPNAAHSTGADVVSLVSTPLVYQTLHAFNQVSCGFASWVPADTWQPTLNGLLLRLLLMAAIL